MILPERQPIPPLCSSTGRGWVNREVREVLAPPVFLDSLQGPSYPVRNEKEVAQYVRQINLYGILSSIAQPCFATLHHRSDLLQHWGSSIDLMEEETGVYSSGY